MNSKQKSSQLLQDIRIVHVVLFESVQSWQQARPIFKASFCWMNATDFYQFRGSVQLWMCIVNDFISKLVLSTFNQHFYLKIYYKLLEIYYELLLVKYFFQCIYNVHMEILGASCLDGIIMLQSNILCSVKKGIGSELVSKDSIH